MTMKYNLFLLNMPFGSLDVPALSLLQLKAMLEKTYRDRIEVTLCYPNHDFAQYIGGVDVYNFPIAPESLISGLGEWFFRQAAFPDVADNMEEYFARYYFGHDEQTTMIRQIIRAKRPGVEAFLSQLITAYRLDTADIVGFTSLFHQNTASFAMARLLKDRYPDMLTVMGGANCEGGMGLEIIKQIPSLDFVFSGPALNSFTEFVGHCLNHDLESCHHIKGVFSRSNAARLEVSQDDCSSYSGEERDINDMLDLDYRSFLDSIESHFPNREVAPHLLFETSRGCWWGERSQCTFCGLNTTALQYREMRPENAIAQFESLFADASRCRHFDATDNIVPRRYVQEVFPQLKIPPDVIIFYEVRADLREEELRILSDAGIKLIQPGIEALATSTLQLMKKGLTAFQNLQVLKNCVRRDIYPIWNLLLGFPGEDEEIYKRYCEIIPLLLHLPPPLGAFPIRYDRYSHYFNNQERYGLDLRPYDFYRLTYPFSEDALQNLAYYFVDQHFQAPHAVAMGKWIDEIRRRVALWQQRWDGKQGDGPPQLYFRSKGNAPAIYDSRPQPAVEHRVSEIGTKILERLTTPADMKTLTAALQDISPEELEHEIAFLKQQQVIFQENERFFSLVFPEKPLRTRTLADF